MNIHFLGHATILVESNSIKCLFDPVLRDPFEDDAVTSCPRRAIDLSTFTKCDLIVISHSHPDHFDPPSLDALDRNIHILCPDDPLILQVIHQLGFQKIHVVRNAEPFRAEKLELHPTPSESIDVTEHGFVIQTDDGTVWNQGDSLCSIEQARRLRMDFGTFEVHLSRYASQNFAFFDRRVVAFPLSEHIRNLSVAVEIGAGIVVPHAAGFRFVEPHDWLNSFVFPVSPIRFGKDLQRLAPMQDCVSAYPGDILVVRRGAVKHLHGASPYAKMIEDDTELIRFNPTSAVPPLWDPNFEQRPDPELKHGTDTFVHSLYLWLMKNESVQSEITILRSLGIHYQLVFVLPDRAQRRYDLWFSHNGIRLERRGIGDPHMVYSVAASVFLDWVELRRSAFFLRAYRRVFSTAVKWVQQDGVLHAREIEFVDLPAIFLRNRGAS